MTLMYEEPKIEVIAFKKKASDVITASSSDVIEEDTGGYDWIGP